MAIHKPGLFSRFLLAASLLASIFVGSGFTPASSSASSLPQQDALGFFAKSGPAPAAPAGAAVNPLLNVINIPAQPVGVLAPTIDGTCSANEYTGGAVFPFTDGPAGTGTGTIYLVHDSSNLYACIVSPPGSFATRFDSLYLDPQGNGTTYTFAQQDDYSLRIDFAVNPTRSSFNGNGAMGGWTDDSASLNPLWSAASSTASGKSDTAEYKVPIKNFGLQVCNGIFGLAGYHHWFSGSGDDYGWPSNQYYDQPRTWQPVVLGGVLNGPGCSGANGKIAYVFRGNTSDALSFYGTLTSAGYSVTLVPLGDVLTTDFSLFDLTLIADDTGSLNTWGTPPDATSASQVAKIILPNKPILGIGEGGYAFFGKRSMFIGWPQGWHGPQQQVTRAATAPPAIFAGVGSDPVVTYSPPTNSVGIYIKPSVPSDVTPVAMEYPADDHANLIQQGCSMLWGSGGRPQGMTSPDGTTLFLNTVGYMRNSQCSTTTPPDPKTCGYTLVKTALPADGTAVPVGGVIQYTLTYQIPVKTNCPATGKLVDVVPFGTAFIPGSSGDGTTPDGNTPAPDGTLSWIVGTSGAPLTKVFKVKVLDNVCAANKLVANFAELRPSAATPLASATIQHPVTCPDIGLPNTQPNFSEDELQVDPYPLVAGVRTQVSVRVTNLGASALPVTVQFQSSPALFGIGLVYASFGTGSASVPAGGTAVIAANFLPVVSGNLCIQAAVSAPGLAAPLITQRCLDVTELLQPGVTDHLIVPVRNNTSNPGTVNLVVDNTCPGFTASVTPASLSGMAVGETRTVSLDVTPPNPATLGSGCHIDLQAWIGDTLIGGIRKLDIPPVHLPENVQPPWEEPEISFRPDPPVLGVAGQICIQLVNPLPTVRHVTVNFSVADFGAGIGFTPATSLTVDLPPSSIATYCAPWTPLASGTLHRCVLATLVQDGYQDQHSQHNVDIVRPSTTDLSGLIIPFVAGNPDFAGHLLTFHVTLVGINPPWMPLIETSTGGLAPASLAGGGQAPMRLRFALISPVSNGLAPAAPPPMPPDFYYGSRSSVEVQILLDGVVTGGFSVQLAVNRSYLPVIKK
jgi:hypothetical protein